MHVHSSIFKGQLIKNIKSITFIVWLLGRVEKCQKQGKKNVKNIFCFVENKCQCVTHVSTPIFQGLFKNIAFRSVAFILKKLWAILDFLLHRPDFLPPCTIPYT